MNQQVTPVDPIAALKAQAEQAVEDAKNRGGSGVCFIPDGITKLRLAFDCEGRMCRSVHRYRIGDVTIPKMDDMSEIDALVKQLEESGCGHAWRYSDQETIISYAYLTSAQQVNEYLKLNQWVIIGYNWKVYNGLMARINEWDAGVVAAMMDPTQEMNLWTIDLKSGKGGTCSVGADLNKAAVPVLPADSKPLREIWIPEGSKPSAEDYQKALTHLKAELAKFNTTVAPVAGAAFSPQAPAAGAPTVSAPTVPAAVAPPVVAPAVAPAPVTTAAPVATPTTTAVVTAPVMAAPPPTPAAPPVATPQGGISPGVGIANPGAPPMVAADGKTCARAAEGRIFGQYEVAPPCLMCPNSANCQAAKATA